MSVTPELMVQDVAAARAMLTSVFGFGGAGDVLRAGDQSIALVQGAQARHGVIDHLALSVPDVGAAAAAMIARGAVPDPAVTPDGPLRIAEFWAGGVEYLFLQGPGGARIELICNLAAPRPYGHDHIGLPCTDIAASVAFVAGLGARLISSVVLDRAEGQTQVRFLDLGGSVLELYQPPRPHIAPAEGLWRRLRLAGLTAPVQGPDGLTFVPA